jgi:hypothetical protein
MSRYDESKHTVARRPGFWRVLFSSFRQWGPWIDDCYLERHVRQHRHCTYPGCRACQWRWKGLR